MKITFTFKINDGRFVFYFAIYFASLSMSVKGLSSASETIFESFYAYNKDVTAPFKRFKNNYF